MPVKKMLIMPVIFTVMSFETLFSGFKFTPMLLLVLLIAILIGSLLGLLQAKYQKPVADIDRKRIYLPGTWSTLVIILIIFASKYYFGYELSMDPKLAVETTFEYTMLIVSGICTGLFIGKSVFYFWLCRKGPWQRVDQLK